MLRNTIEKDFPDIVALYNNKQYTEFALRIRDELLKIVPCGNANVVSGYKDVDEFYKDCSQYKVSTWCGAMSIFYQDVLRSFGYYSSCFSFGKDLGAVGYFHTTNIVALMRNKNLEFYNIDAYIEYEFVDDNNDLMPLRELYRHIKEKNYNEIMINSPERDKLFVLKNNEPGNTARSIWGIYENDTIKELENDMTAFYAKSSLDIFLNHSQDKTLKEEFLALMLDRPIISGFGIPQVDAIFAEYARKFCSILPYSIHLSA